MATYEYSASARFRTQMHLNATVNFYIITNDFKSYVNSVTLDTVDVALATIKAAYEAIYGGTFTATLGTTETINGESWDNWSFTYTGITTDPTTTLDGDLISFVVKDEDSQYYSVRWSLVTADTTTTCPTCLELTKSACQSTYTFVAGLTATTDYWVVIENNRNRRYVQQITTDGSGDFVIDATAPEFPEGFFIPEQFVYTLKVYTDEDLTTEAEIIYNNTIYNCIALSFIYTTTTTGSIGTGVDLWVNDSLDFVIDDSFNTISVG